MNSILSKIKVYDGYEDYGNDTINEGRGQIYYTIINFLERNPELELKEGRFEHHPNYQGDFTLDCIFNVEIYNENKEIYVEWGYIYLSDDAISENVHFYFDKPDIKNAIKQNNQWYILDDKDKEHHLGGSYSPRNQNLIWTPILQE